MDPNFHFDRTFRFDAPTDAVWRELADIQGYPRWLPCIRQIEGELVAGSSAKVLIQAPLPYRLRLGMRVRELEPCARLDVDVTGDLEGPGRLTIRSEPDGSCSVNLAWEVEVRERLLRQARRFGRPIVMWAHDRIVASGLERFRGIVEAD